MDLVDEYGARTILDVGCGTGTLACRLARRGDRVLAVDPAAASLAVARQKRGAERVEGVVGTMADVAANPGHRNAFDVATMTANVAQVFRDGATWRAP